jgi:hypothetical protein
MFLHDSNHQLLHYNVYKSIMFIDQVEFIYHVSYLMGYLIIINQLEFIYHHELLHYNVYRSASYVLFNGLFDYYKTARVYLYGLFDYYF